MPLYEHLRLNFVRFVLKLGSSAHSSVCYGDVYVSCTSYATFIFFCKRIYKWNQIELSFNQEHVTLIAT